jgi:hypothetical protein
MFALMNPTLARLVARIKGKPTKRPTPEWRQRYRQLYGQDPPPWRMGNAQETRRRMGARVQRAGGRMPSLTEVQKVFRLPKTTAWRRLRGA